MESVAQSLVSSFARPCSFGCRHGVRISQYSGPSSGRCGRTAASSSFNVFKSSVQNLDRIPLGHFGTTAGVVRFRLPLVVQLISTLVARSGPTCSRSCRAGRRIGTMRCA
jgi:hypothetical protein